MAKFKNENTINVFCHWECDSIGFDVYSINEGIAINELSIGETKKLLLDFAKATNAYENLEQYANSYFNNKNKKG